jgi:hypothetical protein
MCRTRGSRSLGDVPGDGHQRKAQLFPGLIERNLRDVAIWRPGCRTPSSTQRRSPVSLWTSPGSKLRQPPGGRLRLALGAGEDINTEPDPWHRTLRCDQIRAHSLKRDAVAHLGTLDFIAERGNVVFLGPPGTGKTLLATDIAIRSSPKLPTCSSSSSPAAAKGPASSSPRTSRSESWGEVFGDDTVAAMIDRLVQPRRRHRLRRQLPPGVPRAGGAGEAADGVAGQAQFAWAWAWLRPAATKRCTSACRDQVRLAIGRPGGVTGTGGGAASHAGAAGGPGPGLRRAGSRGGG